ncbi:uncharacterized protein LOC143292750 [Babylonia areolata]|uniref:uncharacterized protein LOC143292750 n=1 Tax=Babylonia areolata TaxID=304850 RepID=UPI003FD35C1F
MTLKVFIRLAGREDSDQPAPFFVDSNAKWLAVKHLLSSYYEDVCPDDLDVRYWDEEDYVIISSQEELEEALRLAEDKAYLQLLVRLMEPEDRTSSKQHAVESSIHCAAYVGEEPAREASKRKESKEESSDHRRSELLKEPDSDSEQKNVGATAKDDEEEKPGEKTIKSTLRSSMENQPDSSSSEKAQLLEYLLKHEVSGTAKAASTQPAVLNQMTEAEVAKVCQHSLRELMAEAGDISFDEAQTVNQADEDESAVWARTMLPGALSGANVIAIEMPEMEHQGTEAAEPAEIAETGEVSAKSSRDAETGFWMQPQLEAEVKAELRRKLSTLVTAKERDPYELLQQKKLERRTSRMDSAHKKKKHRAASSVTDDPVMDFSRKAEARKSSSSLNNSNPLETLSEDVSSDTHPPLIKKHERKSSKSDSKKKKHHPETLTEDAFVRFMSKFEVQLKKDLAKEVAKKTVRSVVKNLPKQGEGSDTASNPPAISTHRSGYVHEDIICDCCDREIVGTRYICGNCPNYDLCEDCEDIQPSFHDHTHVFIKLRRPNLKAGTHHGVRVPLLKRVLYERQEEERKVDPERLQVIIERTKGQEGPMERRMSQNNKYNEEGVEVDDEQSKLQQEEQLADEPKKACDAKLVEATACVDESSLAPDHMMEEREPQESTRLTSENEKAAERELKAQDASDEEDEPLAPEFDNDGFVMCPNSQSCTEEQGTDEQTYEALYMIPPSRSSEVADTDHYVLPEAENISADLQSPVMNLSSEDKADCQKEEGDDASSFSSLTDESSGDEDFVVIVPSCFDISKPLDPVSLARLAQEKTGKMKCPENRFEEDPPLDIPPEVLPPGWLPETYAKRAAEHKGVVHLLSSQEMEGCYSTFINQLQITDEDPDDQTPPAEMSFDDLAYQAAENDLSACSDDAPCINTSVATRETEGRSSAVDEESDVQEEEGASAQGDVPPVAEAGIIQNEACAAVVFSEETEEPSLDDQASEAQDSSAKSATGDPEDAEGADVDETDLKCPPESDKGAAAAAEDSCLDPNEQLNQMMTNTIKKASDGLQQLFQTSKNIFRNLQRGDSYEYQESSYVYKPNEYKMPESTWQPTNKEYMPPKSNFKVTKSEYQMPKSTYTGPQTQVPAGVGMVGEFAGPLQRIREMGYFNNERTLALLRKYEGDVQKVVNELVEETDSDWAERRHGGSC